MREVWELLTDDAALVTSVGRAAAKVTKKQRVILIPTENIVGADDKEQE